MGELILLLMVMLGAIIWFLVIAGVLFIFALLGVPQLFDFVKLFHQDKERLAYKNLLYSFLLIMPLFLFILSFLDKYGHYYQFMAGVFLISSYWGLAFFMLFIYSLKMKHINNIKKSLLIGGTIFLFFAFSSFVIFQPIVTHVMAHPETIYSDILDIIMDDMNVSLELLSKESITP